MADKYSDVITNRDATPPVNSNSAEVAGMLRETVAIISPAADEAVTTDFVICALPSNARISQISVTHAEATVTGQGNIGVMRYADGAYTYTGGDADLFATAYDFDDAGAALDNWVDVELDVLTIALATKPLWECLGLSADPGEEMFLSLDVSEIFSGGPTSVAFRVRYVV
jgi:hypothetical protein